MQIGARLNDIIARNIDLFKCIYLSISKFSLDVTNDNEKQHDGCWC